MDSAKVAMKIAKNVKVLNRPIALHVNKTFILMKMEFAEFVIQIMVSLFLVNIVNDVIHHVYHALQLIVFLAQCVFKNYHLLK